NRLLDLSRLNAGSALIAREEIDLGELSSEVVSRFADDMARSGSQIRLAATLGLKIVWDRFRAEQILTNLLSNAIKYGEGKPIDVEVASSESSVRIVVRDRGIGIPPGDQGRIFERYARAHRGSNGLGLGLYIVR